MRHLVSTADSNSADAVSRTGKLILFAGLEADSGVDFCAASIAVRLARNWRCLVVGLEPEHETLRKYLRAKAIDRKIPGAFHDGLSSLEPLKTKSNTPNLEIIEWPSLPGVRPFLNLLQSDRSDYALATLQANDTGKAIDLFCAADIPVLVMRPGAQAFNKALEFLGRAGTDGMAGRPVYILINGVHRGGEEKEATAWIRNVRQDVRMPLSLIGALTYDPQAEASLGRGTPALGAGPQGSSGFTFEEIVLKIQRLLPRQPAQFQKHPTTNPEKRSRLIAAITSPFARKPSPEMPSPEEQRISELERHLAARQNENNRLAETIDVLSAEKAALLDKSQAISREREALAQRLADAEQRLRAVDAFQQLRDDVLLHHQKTTADLEAFRRLFSGIDKQRIAELENELAARQGENNRLAQANELLSQEKALLFGQNGELGERLAEASSAREAVATQTAETLRLLRADLDGLRMSLSGTRARRITELENDLAARQSEIALLAQEKAVLATRNGELQERLAEVASAREAVLNRTAERVQHLRDDFHLYRRKSYADMDEVRTFFSGLEGDLAARRNENDRLAKAIELLSQEKALLLSQNSELVESLAEVASAREALIRVTANTLQQIRDDIALHGRESQVLLRQNAEWSERLAEGAAAREALIKAANDALQQLRHEVVLHRHEVDADLTARQTENNRFTEAIALLSHEKAALLRQNGELSERLAEGAAAREALIEATNGALQQLRGEVLLHRQGIDADLAAHQTENNRFTEAIALLSHEKAALLRQNGELSERLAEGAAAREALIEATNGALQQLRGEVLLHRQGIDADLAAHQTENDRFTEAIALLSQEKAALFLQNGKLSERLAEGASAREVIMDVTADALQQIRDQIALERQEIRSELAGRLLEASSEARALISGIEEQRISALEKGLGLRETENGRLAEAIDLLSREKLALLSQNQTTGREREWMGQRLAEAEERLRNREVEEREKLILELRQRLAETSSAHEVTINKTTDAVQQLHDEFRLHRETQISELNEKLRATESAAQEMQRKLGVLEETNSSLKLEVLSAVENNAIRPAPETLQRARATLVDKLRLQPPQSATILCIDSGGTATVDFCIEMRSILECAGWTVQLMKSPFEGGQFYGMQVVNDGTEASSIAAKIVGRALENAGLPFVQKIAPASRNVSPLRLIVGRANWQI